MNKTFKNIELLAPAGNMTALHAAVCGGADAVYLGLNHFNARRGADNFTLETLKEACDYAHLRNVKIYLTLNIIIFEHEFLECCKLAYDAACAGVDAFIVQDIGLAHYISQNIPSVRLHISTQMNIHDEYGLRFVAKLGAKRVTLARELSFEEIEHLCDIANDLNIEIETFCHGALCICYSGQCLMSSMIGGRSANRGKCAQPCRLNYELKSGQWSLGKRRNQDDDKRGQYLLSPKDLCSIHILPKFVKCGVTSLKIEGRMKSPEYVYEVVSVYRNAINRIYDGGINNYYVEDMEVQRLQEAFSRGFTTAYLENKRGNEIMSYQRPNNRGFNIGRVEMITDTNISIKTNTDLNNGDILEVWTKRGRSVIKLNNNFKINENNVNINFNKKNNSILHIKKNDRVFRVSKGISSFVNEQNYPKIPVIFNLKLKIGSLANISAKTFVGKREYCVNLEGEIVESAHTKAVNYDEIVAHVDRLGQSMFFMQEIKIDLDENVGVSFSYIHKLRKNVLDMLEKEILHDIQSKAKWTSPVVYDLKTRTISNHNVAVLATNIKNANIAKKNNIDFVYVPALNYDLNNQSFAGIKAEYENTDSYPNDAIIVQPTVGLYSVDLNDKVYCDNLSSVFYMMQSKKQIEIGFHIPIVNSYAINYFKNLGVTKIWLSPELSLNQIDLLVKKFPDISFGVYIFTAQELMISKHCHLMSLGECSQNCKTCKRRQTKQYLIDRKGYEFPVITDIEGRSHIYNSVYTDIIYSLKKLLDIGVDFYMIDSTLMDYNELKDVIKRTKCTLINGSEKQTNTTTGHLYRETL